MALTVNYIGKDIISEKRIVEAVSNEPTCAFVRIKIYNTSIVTPAFEGTNAPEIGTSDTFIFELNSIIRQFYETDFLDLTATVGIGQDFPFVTGTLEELEADGTVLSSSTITLQYIWNISQNIFDVVSFDSTDYDLGDTGTVNRKFSTSSPNVLQLVEGESLFLGINKFSNTLGNAKQRVVVESYDSAGSLTATDYITLTTRSYATVNYALRNAVRITMESGVAYKLIYVADVTGGTIRSEVKRVNNICNARYVHLHWINEFGFQDAYYFKGEQIKELNTDTKIYSQARPVNPTTANQGLSVYDNTVREKWTLYTDSISQDTIKWLSKMYVAKKVAVEIDGNYFPAILDSSSLVYYRDINGIYQIQIPIIFSNNTIGNH